MSDIYCYFALPFFIPGAFLAISILPDATTSTTRKTKKHALLGVGLWFISTLILYVGNILFSSLSAFETVLLHAGFAGVGFFFLYVARDIYRMPEEDEAREEKKHVAVQIAETMHNGRKISLFVSVPDDDQTDDITVCL